MTWKNRKKYPTSKDPVFSTRLPQAIQDAVREMAADEANNTTINAVTVAAFDDWLKANKPGWVSIFTPAPGGALFD